MSRSRHVAVAALTFSVALGTDLITERRDAIEGALGLDGGAAAALTSAATPLPASMAVADPGRLPSLGLEVVGPGTLLGGAGPGQPRRLGGRD